MKIYTDFNPTDTNRSRLIGALRGALNRAEGNQEYVTVELGGVEIGWDFFKGEFYIIGESFEDE